MRTAYRDQLVALTAKIAEICGLATVSMADATRALLRADLRLAERVVSNHEQVLAGCIAAEDSAFTLLVREAPVAGDLRIVVTSIQNVFELERMGALAKHVAGVTQRVYPDHAVPAEVSGDFAEMGRVATELGAITQQALLMRDTETAAAMAEQDDAMDARHAHLYHVLTDGEWQLGVPAAINVAMLARYYERFADHAVEIGRRVNFQVLGHRDDGDQTSDPDAPGGVSG